MKLFLSRICRLFCLLWLGGPLASAQTITTIAGTGTAGFNSDGIVATSAHLNTPYDVVIDAQGNVFIADYNNSRVRRVDAGTGTITTIAGTGVNGFSGDGGPAINARVSKVAGLFLDGAGNLFLADAGDNRIRKIDTSTGDITTIAGTGTGAFGGDGAAATLAQIATPNSVVTDAAGNIYIADYANDRIRKVDAATGDISTIAGTGTAGFSGDGGPANLAQISGPTGIALDAQGNLYFSDLFNNRVRKIDLAGGITTVAGTGSATFNGDGIPATSASLAGPRGLAVDSLGRLFIADTTHQRIRMVDTNGVISTYAGTGTTGFSGDGGLATAAQFGFPSGVQVDSSGVVYVTDQGNERIRRISAPPIGNPPGIVAQPQSASQLAGGSVSLVVTANGTFPLTYQWFFTNGPVAGATGPTLTFNPAQITNSGNYVVVVTNAFGSVTSAVAALTITNSTAPPAITAQPQSQSVNASNTAVFSVTATGALPLAYQWFFNSNAVGGSTASSYALNNVQAGAAGDYFVVVTNAFGSLTSSVATLTVNTNSQPPPLQWAVTGGSVNDEFIAAVAADAAGNSYFGGTMRGTTLIGGLSLTVAAQADAIFGKLDPLGNVLWAKRIGEIGSERGLGVTVDGAGNVFGCGRYESLILVNGTNINSTGGGGGDDIFLVKYNSAGTALWGVAAGGNGDDVANAVTTDAAGNAYLVGDFMGTAKFSPTTTLTNLGAGGILNSFIAKYTPAGAFAWVIGFGGTQDSSAKAIAADAAGNTYVGGNYRGTIQFGTNTLTSAGSADAFLAKLDPNGNVLWLRSIGGTGSDGIRGVAVGAGGAVYVSGSFQSVVVIGADTLTSPSNLDAFTAKFTAAGTPSWARQATGGRAQALALALDGVENVFIAGQLSGGNANFGGTILTNVGGTDAFVTKYDTAGNVQWARRTGSAADESFVGVAADPAGNVFAGGSILANTSFDGLALTTAGLSDMVIVKFRASNSALPVPTGLVGWWAAEGFPVDYAWTNHGYFTNTATITPAGKVGGAFAFNGTTAAVVASTNALKSAYSNLTVEAWVFPTNHSSGTIYGRTVIGHTDGDGFALRLNSGVIQADLRLTGVDVLANFGPVLPLNTWSHIAYTYDGARVIVYLNGAPQGSVNATGTIRNSANPNVPLLIGHEASGATTVDADQRFAWAGLLDEVAVFSRALAATEIQSLFTADAFGKARPAAPTVLVQPQSLTVDPGVPAALGVAAAGYAPLGYQWRLNGTNVPGQTNDTLNIPAAYPVHEGSYDVRLTQFDGASVLSQPATLNVLGQGEAKTLFSVTNDVVNFVHAAGGPSQWFLTSSNTIQVVPGTGNIQSTQSFGDFLLHAEFLLPPTGTGSGIYLQGRYEVQLFNSFGKVGLDNNDCGAIWGQTVPVTNACLAPGVWQSYDITFRQAQWNGNTKVADARVTVVLNGVVVQDNVAMTGRTSGGAAEGPTPGPVILQENGAPVQFRNLRITPLDLPPAFAWTRQFGSTNAAGANTDFARDIGTDAAGNVYVTGSFFGTASFGPTNLISAGDVDFFLAKYSPAGALAWVVRGGGPNFDSGQEIAVGPDGNVYVAGLMESGAVFGTNALPNVGGHDLFLAKYAPDGQLVWVRTGGGSADDGPHGLTVDAGTNVYVTGHLQNNFAIGGTNLTSAGQWDSFLAKYNSDGTFQWARQASGTDFEYAQGVVADEAGNVYTAITFQSLFSLGATNFNNFTARDLCLASYDGNGTLRWARQFALPGTRKLGKLRRDPAGNLLLTLNFNSTLTLGTNTLQSAGSEDIFLAKFDTNGTPLWARQGGSTGDDFNTGDLAVDAQGNAYLVTSFVAPATFNATALPNAGADDVVVAKYNPAGVQLWALSLGSAGTERALGVAVGPDGQAVVGGTFANAIDFRGTPLASFGGNDGFITKLAVVQPLISQQPLGGNVLAGQNATFSVTATGAGTLLYQWRLNGTNLAGATNAAYTIANAATNAAGTYDVLITHTFGSIASSPASVTVIPSANPLPVTVAERFGGPGADSVQALARDAAGNAYLAGYFTGTLNLGTTNLVSAGGDDLFVAKVSPAGTVLWAARCGGPGEERATGLALDPNGDVVVVGWFDHNAVFGTNGAVALTVNLAAFTLRLSTDGQLTGFHKVDYDGAGASILKMRNFAVAVDATGAVYVAGKGNDTNNFGAFTFGRPGVWSYLVKYDRSGSVQWIQASDCAPGASQNALSMTVALDNAGGVYLGGFYGLPGGASGTNAIIGGITLPYGGGDADAFVAKFTTATGTPVWTRGLNGPGAERVTRLATDSFGNVFASGDFDAVVDFGPGVLTPSNGATGTGLLLKLDAAGSVVWAREVGATDGLTRDNGALATDAVGNVYLAHNFTGTSVLGNPGATSGGGRDALLAKFSAGGGFLWAQTFGSVGDDFVNGLVLDTNFNLHLAGTLGGAATLGPFTLTNAGATDVFLARIASIPPVITAQPASQTIGVTQPVTFTVVATGTLPFTYQWRFNGTNIAGATNATFTLPSVVPASAGSYSVLVGDALGLAVSSGATLAVDTSNVPFITGQPQGQTVLQGAAVLLTVTAVGASPLNYQWRKNGTNLAGEVFDFLALGGVNTNANGSYTIVVTNVFGAVTSAPAVLTVTPVFPPVITNHPASLTVLVGANATFTVAASGTGPFSYQWIRNGVGLPGNDTPSLTITNATLADAGSYFAQVFNSAGLATSSNATLTVHALPQFLSVPQPVIVLQGATTNFSASASGTPAPAFQWFKDGVRLTNTVGYSGVATPNLLVLDAQGAQAGGYVIVATNVAGAITSAPVTLTVLLAPTITAHPTNVTLTRTNYTNALPVTLRVAATGAPPLLYQWRFNGGDLAGETNTTLTLTNVTRLRNGLYQAVVTNIVGTAASSNALVRVRGAQRVEPPVFSPGAPFRLRFTDDNGELASPADLAKIEVQATTNLAGPATVWVTLTNGLSVVNGMLQLDDSAGTNALRRYYRVIER